MKSTSTIKPAKFTFERNPRGGFVLWLRENFHEVEYEIDSATFRGWIYDEYKMKTDCRLSDSFIEQHFDEYLSEARKKEAMDISKRVTAAEDAIADLAELIGGLME